MTMSRMELRSLAAHPRALCNDGTPAQYVLTSDPDTDLYPVPVTATTPNASFTYSHGVVNADACAGNPGILGTVNSTR